MNLNENIPKSSSNKFVSLMDIQRQKSILNYRSKSVRYVEYLTLDHLDKCDHSDATTDITTSTRFVQQHLQNTATRWWRPIHSSSIDKHLPALVRENDKMIFSMIELI